MSKDKKSKRRKQAAQSAVAKGFAVDNHPDAKLFAAIGELRKAEAVMRFAPMDDAEVEAFDNRRTYPHIRTIIETEAKSAHGLRVKFAVLADWAEFGFEEPKSTVGRLAKSLEHDLRGISIEAPPPRQRDIRPDLEWLVNDLRNPTPSTTYNVAEDRREIADRLATILKGGAA